MNTNCTTCIHKGLTGVGEPLGNNSQVRLLVHKCKKLNYEFPVTAGFCCFHKHVCEKGHKPNLFEPSRKIYGVVRCEKCEAHLGWYCEQSPTQMCEYKDGDENCIHCGQPEERK